MVARRLLAAAAGCFLTVAAYGTLLAFGWVFALPGRGSESAYLANVWGAALLLIALADTALAFGFRAVLRNRLLARSAAFGSFGASLAIAILGSILLFDRVPCEVGLYCSGQTLGSFGRWALYLSLVVPGVGNLVLGGLLLPEPMRRRRKLFAAAGSLLILHGGALALFFGLLFALAAPFWLLVLALVFGLAAYVIMGVAFVLGAYPALRSTSGRSFGG